MDSMKELVKLLNAIPWFIGLGVILLINVLVNVDTASLDIQVANAVTQMLIYFVIGYRLWRENAKAQAAGTFNVFLMVAVFIFSTIITWFSPTAELVAVSVWGLMIAQVFLAAATLLHYYPVKTFGAGNPWHYASLLSLLIVTGAGAWIYLIHTGISQGLLWNMSVGIICFGYLMKKANLNLATFLKFAAVLIAMIAAFGFSGIALTLLP